MTRIVSIEKTSPVQKWHGGLLFGRSIMGNGVFHTRQIHQEMYPFERKYGDPTPFHSSPIVGSRFRLDEWTRLA